MKSWKSAKLSHLSQMRNSHFNQDRYMESGQRSNQGKINPESLAGWLFLIGSLMFVLDAILENIKGISFSSILHLLASILFTIGSVFFILNNN